MFKPCAPPSEIIDFIKQNSHFVVAGHREPDGDCIGSQIALGSALNRLGKNVILCQAGPFKRREVSRYADRFVSELPAAVRCNAAAIIVDCSSRERTGEEIEKQLAGLPFAIIDHHARCKDLPDASYIDANAPAATVLVCTLIKSLGLDLTQEEAELLFLGLCTDSGFFRHLESGGGYAFSLAAELVDAGASPKKTFEVMSGGKSLNSRRLLGAILSRVTSYFDDRLLVSTERLEETERYGLEGRDSDSLYQLLMAVDKVEAIAVIRQESAQSCTVGLRSREKIDVSRIADALGGGGHKNAAGIAINGQITEIQDKLLSEFKKDFLAAFE
ncbi:MAG: bifunctional oligoribonuclease/PAP phosphatase NrnA [Spirochaetaceae bacterium]|jgi:phosphoesterase RecJ-like protein|nr:bifunctional oligoribonuclease/PAP phosphatase NrnA [Spirochaetaceae bacterium]